MLLLIATTLSWRNLKKKNTRVLLQTLIKLERWLDAVEFCDRALHVNGKCVKALSRRASAFVKLAEDSTTSGVAPAAAAPATVSPRSDAANDTESQAEVVIKGGTSVSIDVSDLATTANDKEAVSGTEVDGETSGRGEEHAFRVRFGGREGLMALALLDLHAAVEADPDSEDIRRQRDGLSKEIEEEKVRVTLAATSVCYTQKGVSEYSIPEPWNRGS